MLHVAPALATDTHWTGNGGDANWNNSANWSHGLPDGTGTSYIRNGLTATVDGAVSFLNDRTFIGRDGSAGNMTVVNGGNLSGGGVYLGAVAGSPGSMTVSGTGSSASMAYLSVGRIGGTGQLLVEDGGSVNANYYLYIGGYSEGVGEVTVTGPRSILATGPGADIQLGGTALSNTDAAQGTLNLLDGGTARAGDGDEALVVAVSRGSTGTLNIGNGGAAGILEASEVKFGNGTGTVNFNHNETGYDFGTPIVGDGAVNIIAGTTILGGANNYSGGTTISGGTLQGNTSSLKGDIVNDATLVFDQASDGVYSGAMSGSGLLEKRNAGTLTLSGNSSAFKGTATLSGGNLFVTGQLGGTLNISGGTLAGSGTLGNVALGSGALLAPGNSIGTTGAVSATFNSGSTYQVELKEGGFVAGTHNDLLDASGTVTINGGTVHVTPENGTDDGSTYGFGTYTIISAAGGVTGTFDSDTPTDDYAFLNFSLTYGANDVFLTSMPLATTFCLAGMTANQCAAGDAVFSLGPGSLYTAVLNLSDAQAPGALDQLSGEIHASLGTVLVEDSRFIRNIARERIRAAFAGATTAPAPVLGYAADGWYFEPPGRGGGSAMWASAFGTVGQWDGNGNAAGLDHWTSGLLVGADAVLRQNLRLGVLAGYSHTGLDIGGRGSSGSAETYHLGVYGGWEMGDLVVSFGGAYGWHAVSTSRSVAFTGFSDSLSVDYDARTAQLFGEAAYRMRANGATVEPFANLAYVDVTADGFSETGGGAALGAASSSRIDTAFSTLGVRTEAQVTLEGTPARLHAALGWRHAFGDVSPDSTHAFSSGGTSFAVAGVPIARDSAEIEAGVDLSLAPNMSFDVSYSGQLAAASSSHGLKASLVAQF